MCKSSLLCAGVQTDDIQSGIVVPSRNLLAVVVEGEERRLHLGLFGMPLDCEERERERERDCPRVCVCVHMKVDSKVMFCFNFLDLSLYDVKYKCLPKYRKKIK